MLRLTLTLLPAALLVACGDPATTTGQGTSDSSTGAATAPSTTDVTPTTSTTAPTTGDTSTGGSNSATDSATGSTTVPDPTTGGTTVPDPTTGPDETTGTTTPDTTGSTGPIDTTGDTSTGDSSTGDSSTGAVEACACPDLEVALDDGIFVLSSTADLWKYYPMSNTFEELGTINCPGLFNQTFSMAVDRLGFAWVQFTGGELRRINVTKVDACDDPGYVLGQQNVQNFGMAFVSNSESDACDRIYGNTYSGNGGYTEGPNVGDFITIDPDNLALSKLGKTNFDGAEVTGTGDGRAFVFGGVNPSKLVELDKTDGSVVQVVPLAGLEINNSAFAFAFFAGDFYFFTDSNVDFTNSEVTHLDFDDSDNNGIQDLTLLTDDAPLLIVGAGVSTCAPTAPQ
jgi:hypothetical protein